jgi:murein DD-endopeptidase MepM/ murein hydrolase activator NlpD
MYFGQNENPFTGQYYIHKGIDLSTYRQGDPIVATADGQVVAVDYDAGGFGNNVIIRHKHGFYTRYGHMLSIRVQTGQRVQQGEVIGYIGNTGLSTGPHVHYEVHIGSDVVDPYKYLNIRSSIARTAR